MLAWRATRVILQRRLSTALSSCASASPPPPLLHSYRVVLVSPIEAGNVGMASRSCANFECRDLALVSPRYTRSGPIAASHERRFASQETAIGVLDEATMHTSLLDALADCSVAVGFTRRRGKRRAFTVEPRELAALSDPAGPPSRRTANRGGHAFGAG